MNFLDKASTFLPACIQFRTMVISTDYDHLSDETLVHMIGCRDSGAFSALFDRYAPQMLMVAMIVTDERRTAETAVEQIFHDLWQEPRLVAGGGASVRNSLMLRARLLAGQFPQHLPLIGQSTQPSDFA